MSLETPEWSASVDDYPTAVAFSSDGALLAVADAAGWVTIFDAETGVRRSAQAHDPQGLLALSWRTATHSLAVAGQSGLVTFIGYDGESSSTELGSDWIEHLAWSPDGGKLAAASGRQVFLIDAAGRIVARSERRASTVAGLAFRAGGRHLLSCCYGGVTVHDPQSLASIRHFRWKGSMISMAASPDGKIVACGCQDGTVHFWRFSNGSDAQMSGYPVKPASLSWSADSRWLATSGAATVTLWPFDGRGPEGRPPTTLEGHEAALEAVAFAPAGAGLATGCRAGDVCLWLPEHHDRPVTRANLAAPVSALAWSVAGDRLSLAVVTAGGRVSTWTMSATRTCGGRPFA